MSNAWQIQATVAGVGSFEPGFKAIPEGPYAVQIVSSELKPSSDPGKAPSLHFEVKLMEGEAQGQPTKVVIGTDFSKDGNKKHLRGLLLALGANPQALDSGPVNLSADMFNGKQAYIYVSAPTGTYKDKTTGEEKPSTIGDRNFIAPAFYQQKKAEFAAKAAGASAAPTAAAPQGANGMAGLGANLGGAPAPQQGFGGASLFGRQ
jgi:hypothetical protein